MHKETTPVVAGAAGGRIVMLCEAEALLTLLPVDRGSVRACAESELVSRDICMSLLSSPMTLPLMLAFPMLIPPLIATMVPWNASLGKLAEVENHGVAPTSAGMPA